MNIPAIVAAVIVRRAADRIEGALGALIRNLSSVLALDDTRDWSAAYIVLRDFAELTGDVGAALAKHIVPCRCTHDAAIACSREGAWFCACNCHLVIARLRSAAGSLRAIARMPAERGRRAAVDHDEIRREMTKPKIVFATHVDGPDPLEALKRAMAEGPDPFTGGSQAATGGAS